MLPAIEQSVRAGEAVIPPFNLLGLPLAPAIQLQCAENFIRQGLPADAKTVPKPAAGRSPAGSGWPMCQATSGNIRSRTW